MLIVTTVFHCAQKSITINTNKMEIILLQQTKCTEKYQQLQKRKRIENDEMRRKCNAKRLEVI